MKRQVIAIGLAALGLVLLAFIVATMAAPDEPPTETEPNNDFTQANPMGLSIAGVLSNSQSFKPGLDTVDFFTRTTTIGERYQANLTVLQNSGSMLLRMQLYNAEQDLIATSLSSASAAALDWTASASLHYVRVEALSVYTQTTVVANYRLDVNKLATTPTPTNTPEPGEDAYEPNDDPAVDEWYQLPIAVSSSATGANFHIPTDKDWYRFYVKSGRYYEALTSNLIGVDTRIDLHKEGDWTNPIKSDNDGGGGFASLVEWRASYDGWYYVRVSNIVKTDPSDPYDPGNYDLTVREVAAPPTATPTPAPTTPGQIDSCEDNSVIDRACTIAANAPEVFNFVSPHSGPDNDYYRIWVKPGLLFDCRTSNLSPGVDPNMIVYDHNRNAIGGNDDVAPGDYNSAFSYYSTYSGWLYLLIGYGDRTPADYANSNYTLNCTTGQPGDPTPTSQAVGTPTATAVPNPVATATPQPPGPTPEPAPNLTVRVLTTPAPGAAVTPAPRFVPITLVVYYDANDDYQLGAGEGIGGVSAQAYEASTNQLLAQGFTDDRGQLEFTVAALGPVRVSIPFLGFSQLVAGQGGTIYVRVAPTPSVGGAP